MRTATLLLVLCCTAGLLLALSQPGQKKPLAVGATPSPALLDAMNSHGIGTGAAAATPAMQPALYHGGDNR